MIDKQGGVTVDQQVRVGAPADDPGDDIRSALTTRATELRRVARRALASELQALARALDADPDAVMATCGVAANGENSAFDTSLRELIGRWIAAYGGGTPTLSAILSSVGRRP